VQGIIQVLSYSWHKVKIKLSRPCITMRIPSHFRLLC
jgi:hypothetical protein